MQKRKLGSSSLGIAPLTLGGNIFGWTINEKESFRILDGFVDAGASATTPGQLESLIKATLLKLDQADIELLNDASAWQEKSIIPFIQPIHTIDE